MISVQGMTTRYLDEGDKQVDGLIFTPRWGDVAFVEPSSPTVLFADCLPGEFAISGQQILGGSDLRLLESYAVAMPSNFMVWLMVVDNENTHQRLPASAGVICASDKDVDKENTATTIILQPQIKQKINNIIKQYIKIQNNQIINLQQIINLRQNIVQNAINVAIAGGDVSQSIDQQATQIASSVIANNSTTPSSNTTSTGNVNQRIDQEASQVANSEIDNNATSGNTTTADTGTADTGTADTGTPTSPSRETGSNTTSTGNVNQRIDQEASQVANSEIDNNATSGNPGSNTTSLEAMGFLNSSRR
jgi:hypothetical protein